MLWNNIRDTPENRYEMSGRMDTYVFMKGKDRTYVAHK